MTVNFTKDSFKGAKLFIGTPMYGGICYCNYLVAMADLFSLCTFYNIPLKLHTAANEGLLEKERNECVNSFLESDFTHLLFIDSDIGFKANDVLSLLYTLLSDKENKYDVVGGPYAKKRISWRKVKCAVEKEVASKDSNDLENYIGDYVFIGPPNFSFTFKKPAKVLTMGTGFMIVPRRTFEQYREFYKEKFYVDANNQKKHVFFDCAIDVEEKFYRTEDYMFCKNVRKMGGDIWLAPWIQLTHQGKYTYEGSILNLIAADIPLNSISNGKI